MIKKDYFCCMAMFVAMFMPTNVIYFYDQIQSDTGNQTPPFCDAQRYCGRHNPKGWIAV